MSDSTLKTVLGVAAVGAAGVGVYYLVKKAGSTVEPVIKAVDTISETNDGINETIKEITSSNRPNSTVIVEEALNNAGITNAPELLKYNLLPGNITAANVGLNIFSDAIANLVQGAWNSLTGSPAGSETTITPDATKDKDELREAADNTPVPVTDKTATVKSIIPTVTMIDPAAANNRLTNPVPTVKATPTPIVENKTVGQATKEKLSKIKIGTSADNYGAGKTVTGIPEGNQYVATILSKLGYTVKN